MGIALELIDTVLDGRTEGLLINVLELDGEAGRILLCRDRRRRRRGRSICTGSPWIRRFTAAASGPRLNAHAEELIRSRGGRLIVVETSSRPQYEPTREFYLRRGYAETARIPGLLPAGRRPGGVRQIPCHHTGG